MTIVVIAGKYLLDIKIKISFFFWIFKGSYHDIISEKYKNRNLWIGYILTLATALLVVYFIVKGEI